jgi:drug/metabolite transporter (DMT)-like permease
VIGLAKGAQLQLLKPIVTMILSIVILHVAVSPITWVVALVILVSVVWSQRFR